MLKSASFWEKASAERRRSHGIQAGQTFQIITGIVVDAIRCGDVPPETRPADVTLSLISITMGSHVAAMEPDIQMLCGITDPLCVVRRNQDLVCDGWNWKPLLKDWDYAATDRRINAEIFPEATWLKAA